MRALEVAGPKQVRIVERPVPVPGPGEVRIRVHWAGVCGTDQSLIGGSLVFAKYPIVPGHEFSGRVSAVGKGADFELGQPVTVNPVLSCQECEACRRGDIQLCPEVAVLGVAGTDGAFADEVVVPAYAVRRLPSDLSLEAAALAEPTAVAVRAARRAEIKAGDRVAILGAGSLGLLILQIARVLGAAHVGIADPIDARMRIALGLGGSHLDSAKEAGDYDVVIDGVGMTETLQRAVDLARRGGSIVVYGVPRQGSTELPIQDMFRKNLRLVFARLYPSDISEAIGLLQSGQVNWKAIVTHRVALEDLPATIASVMSHPEVGIKVLAQIA